MNAPNWSSIRQRLLNKVVVAEGGCWNWTGSLDVSGYARIAFRGRNCRASRVSWCSANETEWPEGKHALHSCDNRRCVNPAHIRPGTNAENVRDSWNRGGLRAYRQEVKGLCRRGHALTPDNLVTYPSIAGKSPRCRQCERLLWSRRKANREIKA